MQDRRWHTHKTNLANQCPCWVVEALTLRRCVFLMSSEIFQLTNPGKLYLILSFKLGIVGQLEELAICSQVGRQREGRWEFALCVFGVSLNLSQYHTIEHFWPSKMLFRGQCIRKCSANKDVKQECWIVELKEGASLEKAWTEEGTEFHWSDLTGFLQMTSNWANGHSGSLWLGCYWVRVSFFSWLKLKLRNKMLNS